MWRSIQMWYYVGGKEIIAVLLNYLKLWRQRFHIQFAKDGNCRSFMICYMFQEICICLVIHRTGMPVQVNIVWLILPKDQHEEHKNAMKHSSCRLHNGSGKHFLDRASTLLAMQKTDVYWKGNQNNWLNHLFWESLMLQSCIQLVLHLLLFQTKVANTMSSILLW